MQSIQSETRAGDVGHAVGERGGKRGAPKEILNDGRRKASVPGCRAH